MEIMEKGSEILRFSNVQGQRTTMHSHHFHNIYEIYYMVSGRCQYLIDEREYEINMGDVVFIPEGVVHKTKYGEAPHRRLLIECSAHFIPDALKEKMTSTVFLCRSSRETQQIYELLQKIEKEYEKDDYLTPESLKSYMSLLFVTLARSKNTIGLGETKNPIISKAVSYIKSNFNSDITLSDVAKAHFISSEHLSRTFKKEMGVGFSDFVTMVRLQNAENMLKSQDDKSISEIAYSCGFNDSNYFSDKFKKVYGISPLKYSKKNKNVSK